MRPKRRKKKLSEVERRVKRLQKRLAAGGLAGLVVLHRPNVRYLTGFTGEGWLLVRARGQPRIITDPRYGMQAQEEAPQCALDVVSKGYLMGAAHRLSRTRSGPVGFEGDYISYTDHKRLQQNSKGCRLKAARRLVEELRWIKSEHEIQRIKAAVAVADQVYEDLAPRLRPGQTERDVAWEIEGMMRELGAEKAAFPTIVASGPRSALPHAIPTDRKFGRRDQVKLDFGAVVNGYHSDMTRMVFLGKPTKRQREVYGLCYEAQQAALEAARAGITAAELDAVARDVFRRAGCADAFGHGLGHGVGLEVHEAPALSARSQATLEPGMVVTIEPGLYFEGWGGVRIEDLVVIREDAAEVLTQASKVEL